jgi:iron complex outermembrane receptor protein
MRSAATNVKRRLWWGTVSAGALLLVGGQAFGAETGPASVQLDELVVTAQHRSENIQDVPISIQAFTAEKIKSLGVKTTSDLAQFTPNVSIALPAGAGNQPIITIRGIGLNDFNTNNAGPNGVYLDEVYLSSPSSQTFQTFDLERVEVLKGPQGTLYGRNTSGGAINLVSAKPTDSFAALAHAEYSSFNSFNFEGAVGGPITSTLDGRFATTWTKSDGYAHNLLTGGDENGANNVAVRGQLLWKPIDDLKVLFGVNGGYVDVRPTAYRHLGSLDATGALCSAAATAAGQCVDLFGFGTPAKFYDVSVNRHEHLRVKDFATNLHVDYKVGDIDLVSISSFNRNAKRHPEDSDASPNRLLEIDFGVKSAALSQEFRVSRTTDRYTWVAGAYYLHESLKQDQPIEVLLGIDSAFGAPGLGDGLAFTGFGFNRQVTNSGAIFGQGEYKVTDRLKLVAGGRFTSERKTFASQSSVEYQDGGEGHYGPIMPIASARQRLTDSAFSWRLGANYDLAPDVMAYASIATGFKSGGFNGGFLSQTPAEALRQLEPVQPETVTAYELGFKSSFLDRRVTLNVAAFYNDYKDMQVFVLIPPVVVGGFPLNVLDNAKKAETKGIDAEITVIPIPGLTLSAQVGLLRATLTDFVAVRDPTAPNYSGNRLPLAPRASASLSATWKHDLGPGVLEVQANANYKGFGFFDVSNGPYGTQAGYWIENARVAYALDAGRWEVAGYVHNLSGEKYYVDKYDLTSPFGVVQGIVGAPRAYGVELNYRF